MAGRPNNATILGYKLKKHCVCAEAEWVNLAGPGSPARTRVWLRLTSGLTPLPLLPHHVIIVPLLRSLVRALCPTQPKRRAWERAAPAIVQWRRGKLAVFRLLHVHWCGATQSLVRPFVLGKHYCITGAFKNDEANAVGYAISYSSTRSPDKLHNLPGSLRGGLERAKCPISYPQQSPAFAGLCRHRLYAKRLTTYLRCPSHFKFLRFP